MHASLKTFLAATHEDSADRLAQRALNAHSRLYGQQGLIASAYQRGDAEAYTAVSRAHLGAAAAFFIVNATKNYPFAAAVLDEMPELAILGDAENAVAAAEVFLAEVDAVIGDYAKRCTPVCTIVGDVGVRILRGAHAVAAAQSLVPANQA